MFLYVKIVEEFIFKKKMVVLITFITMRLNRDISDVN